jgi:hypothetical protein
LFKASLSRIILEGKAVAHANGIFAKLVAKNLRVGARHKGGGVIPHLLIILRVKESSSNVLVESYATPPRLLSARRRRRTVIKQQPKISLAFSRAVLHDEEQDENEVRKSVLQLVATSCTAIVVDVFEIFETYVSMHVMPL